MSIFEKIRDFIRRITNRTPQIEAAKIETPKERPDGFVAPKGTKEDDTIESFAKSLSVSKSDLLKVPVTFGNLDTEVFEKLAKNMGGKLGWTHNSKPTISGKLNGKNFASVKRTNVVNTYVGQTVCTEDGYYDIQTSKTDPQSGSYKEGLTHEDGTTTSFSTRFGKDNNATVRSSVSKDGISLIQSAHKAIVHGEAYEFENFAQPSNELLGEYSRATGLPIIMDCHKMYGDDGLKKTGLPMAGLGDTMKKQDSSVSSPYIVSIEVRKDTGNPFKPMTKAIKYAYTSPEAYLNGEKPYMIYMDGIDGRKGFSGMFRLQGDSYVDNSTFRRENGKYTYDKISYESIMELAGKMPTQLSQRVNSAIAGTFKMSPELQNVYSKATSIEQEKEQSSDGIGLS